MPVVFDEVMTGLFRLGHVTAATALRLEPDIACYAKLMTAGLVPMAATLTSEAVFNTFQGDSKVRAWNGLVLQASRGASTTRQLSGQ
jgi:dethiobiotin synthetase/adenosylmethionine--8-amino-7-oxononanoate aminotransferase